MDELFLSPIFPLFLPMFSVKKILRMKRAVGFGMQMNHLFRWLPTHGWAPPVTVEIWQISRHKIRHISPEWLQKTILDLGSKRRENGSNHFETIMLSVSKIEVLCAQIRSPKLATRKSCFLSCWSLPKVCLGFYSLLLGGRWGPFLGLFFLRKQKRSIKGIETPNFWYFIPNVKEINEKDVTLWNHG